MDSKQLGEKDNDVSRESVKYNSLLEGDKDYDSK